MLFDTVAVLACLSAIGSGLMAGVFFAFSNFVMRALAKLPAPAAIEAMQSISIVVLNPMFLGVFVGSAIVSVAAAVASVFTRDASTVTWMALGAASYVIGTFGVTMIRNVPLNNALARTPASDPGAERIWKEYQRDWTRWNHVRAIAATAAMVSFIVAFRR